MVNVCTPSHASLLQKADALLEQEITAGKPIIAAWGLMNAGKSFLLNMLTNHIQTECFRTNDIRETAELSEFETDDFVFLDTPGLDANNADDLIALQGAAKADIVLFVHQPQGELEQIEMDFLRQLKASFGEYAEQNIILILSKADVESAENIAAIEKRMLEQCRDDLGFMPRCYALSGSRFHAGVMQKQEGLIRASRLYDLAEHLDGLNTDAVNVKRERQRVAVEEIIAEFIQAETALHEQFARKKSQIQNGFQPFDKVMENFRASMEHSLKNFPAV